MTAASLESSWRRAGAGRLAIVTGAGGFVGRHTVGQLLRDGWTVTGIVHSRRSVATSPDYVELHHDLRFSGALTRALSVSGGPEACVVVHAAAVLPASHSGSSDELSARENTRIDTLVIREAEKLRIPMVFVSSASAYSSSGTDIQFEDVTPQPQGRYASAKVDMELLGLASDIPFAALRLSSPYGLDQSVSNVLTKFVELAVAGSVIGYYGSGQREQDFVYVGDVAEAIERAAQRSDVNAVVNVASGAPVSMRGLAELVASTVSPPVNVKPAGLDDPQERQRVRISIARARELFGWSPRTALDDGIRQIVADRTERSA